MTIFVFDQELSALGAAPADGDVMLVHDTSAGVKKYMTWANMRQGISAIVSTTATTLSVTATEHANRTVVISSASPIAVTLPQATGTGDKYRFVLAVAATGTAHTISVGNATDDFNGSMAIFDTSATDITAIAFAATATDDRISLNGTTKAGTVGTVVEIEDVATGLFSAVVRGAATGSYASPFDANV